MIQPFGKIAKFSLLPVDVLDRTLEVSYTVLDMTQDISPSIVVTGATVPAADERASEIISGNVFVPTTEHKELAKKLLTSLPSQFSAIHWPVNPAHCDIKQKHPVSQ